jgi:hypothetical protein
LKVAHEVGVGNGTVERIKQEMTGPFRAQMKIRAAVTPIAKEAEDWAR